MRQLVHDRKLTRTSPRDASSSRPRITSTYSRTGIGLRHTYLRWATAPIFNVRGTASSTIAASLVKPEIGRIAGRVIGRLRSSAITTEAAIWDRKRSWRARWENDGRRNRPYGDSCWRVLHFTKAMSGLSIFATPHGCIGTRHRSVSQHPFTLTSHGSHTTSERSSQAT